MDIPWRLADIIGKQQQVYILIYRNLCFFYNSKHFEQKNCFYLDYGRKKSTTERIKFRNRLGKLSIILYFSGFGRFRRQHFLDRKGRYVAINIMILFDRP